MPAKILIGGREREISYPVNSIRAIEKRLDLPIQQVFMDAYKNRVLSIDTQTVIIWGGLLPGDRDLTDAQVGEMILDGEFRGASAICQRELARSFNRMAGIEDSEEDDEKNG